MVGCVGNHMSTFIRTFQAVVCDSWLHNMCSMAIAPQHLITHVHTSRMYCTYDKSISNACRIKDPLLQIWKFVIQIAFPRLLNTVLSDFLPQGYSTCKRVSISISHLLWIYHVAFPICLVFPWMYVSNGNKPWKQAMEMTYYSRPSVIQTALYPDPC